MDSAYLSFSVAYGKEVHAISLPAGSTVGDLKEQIEALVGVAAANQKLVGLPKVDGDAAPLRGLPLKVPTHKLLLMGTRDEALRAARAAEEAAAAAAAEAAAEAAAAAGGDDDDDGGPSRAAGDGDPHDISSSPAFLALCEKRVATYRPKVLAGLRPGATKLLVTDVDYVLLDHHTVAETPLAMMRPYLHDMLAAAYAAGYDIIVWSATGMSWIDVKMRELGVTRSPSYKVAAFLDRGAMITVEHARYGRVDVKPLPVLWGLIRAMAPGCTHGPSTTIMFDDLRRNFLMNPRTGLRVEACRNMPAIRATDRELLHLSKYLASIAGLPSLEGLDHREWRRYLADTEGYRDALEDHRARRRAEEAAAAAREAADADGGEARR